MIELNISFVIQVINFGILVFILNAFLYKPIRKVLADRRQVIDAARDKTVSVDAEVENKMAQYEARLHAAKAEAGSHRADALKVAQAEEAAVLDKARKQAAESLASIKVKVAAEAAEARELLKKQAEELSGDICEKILGRTL
ncbi:MAG: ATP synthase F0 subunit B [Desulfuromonadaceae bacterium]|nr:ATP synthase F0 subunit B [Desulfuromonadaceae bacterium]MDD2853958.1 ATP synthase F0 subunit B [Desulfuromonadaceae bacterium]